jgi:hypothetical protein
VGKPWKKPFPTWWFMALGLPHYSNCHVLDSVWCFQDLSMLDWTGSWGKLWQTDLKKGATFAAAK